MRRLLALCLITTLGCGLAVAIYSVAAAAAKPLVISTTNERFWHWQWQGNTEGAQYRLITSAAQARELLQQVAEPARARMKERLAGIDYGKQVAVVAYLGVTPTTGYRVEIGQITIMGQDLLIDIGMQAPSAGQVTAPALDYPFDIETLPRADISPGEIRYQVANQHGTVLVKRTVVVNEAKRDTPTPQPGEQGKKPPAGERYTVKTGDTLWALAQRFGTTIEHLLALNPGIDPNTLYIGQVLRVQGPVVLPAPSKPGRHTVMTGESLWSIALKYEVTVEQLMRWNRLKDYTIMAGQELIVKA